MALFRHSVKTNTLPFPWSGLGSSFHTGIIAGRFRVASSRGTRCGKKAHRQHFFFCICICIFPTPPGRTAVMMLPYYIASRNVIALTTTKKNVRLDYTSSRQPGVLCTQCLSQSGQPPSCRSKTVPAENYILSRELEATTVCSARSCCGLHFCSDAPSSTATRFSSPYWCCLRYLDRQN